MKVAAFDALVVDASVSAAWFLDETGSVVALDLLRGARPAFFVPPNLLAEMGIVAETGADELGRTLSVLELARAHRLSAYDAQYLELAYRRRLPLATFDRRLAAAARSLGLPLALHRNP